MGRDSTVCFGVQLDISRPLKHHDTVLGDRVLSCELQSHFADLTVFFSLLRDDLVVDGCRFPAYQNKRAQIKGRLTIKTILISRE